MQSSAVDLKLNVDGFLLAIQPAEARWAVSAEEQWDSDADEGEAQPAEQGYRETVEVGEAQRAEQGDGETVEAGEAASAASVA